VLSTPQNKIVVLRALGGNPDLPYYALLGDEVAILPDLQAVEKQISDALAQAA
jgi:hypothetical protein